MDANNHRCTRHRHGALRSLRIAVGGMVLALAAASPVGTPSVVRADPEYCGETAPTAIGRPAVVGGRLLFPVEGAPRGPAASLWRSDGSRSETALVRTIRSSRWGMVSDPFAALGDTLLFAADDGRHGRELWRSDGTRAGTSLVRDIRAGRKGSVDPWSEAQAVVADTLYFAADDGEHGPELWRSDGTRAGTTLVKDILPGPGGSLPNLLTAVGDTLYFTASDGGPGAELWRSDGTADGTTLVSVISSSADGAYPSEAAALGDTLLFVATDVAHGEELWRSDGTSTGTMLVADIRPGPLGSGPSSLAVVGDTMYFSADDGIHGPEPWRSDGTSDGTTMVVDALPGEPGTRPGRFVDLAGALLFAGVVDPGGFQEDGASVYGLWRTDGTAAGTSIVTTLTLTDGTGDEYPDCWLGPEMLVVEGTLYFAAHDKEHGAELWRTDGTEAGTSLVKDVRPGRGSARPYGLTELDGSILFIADGTQLWRSDGSPEGTTRLRGFGRF